MDVRDSFNKLHDYVLSQEFKGWDPYDGLNSTIFRASGLDKIPIARLAWIQFFKRSPMNLRRALMVPKGYNPKGLGLFLSCYSKALLHNQWEDDNEKLQFEDCIDFLAKKLIDTKTQGYSGACWGYNFDWQARGGLFFPAGTPTVVATTYAAYGLFDAYEATGKEEYLNIALDAVKFVTHDLNRDYRRDDTFLFSYSVRKGNNTVYNASLLGSKLLSRAYHYSSDEATLDLAKKSVLAVVDAQHEDGSWVYGELGIQNWIDSFHTGFNLECIADYMKYSGDRTVEGSLQKGFKFYIENFFTEEGVPKYFNDKVYPIDIHCPAQFIVTLSSMDQLENYRDLVNSVLAWTIQNMQDPKGYFYYQVKPMWKTRIPYMRWSQAWMAHSLMVLKIHSND